MHVTDGTSKLQLRIEDENDDAQHQHPSCAHGPTVLFYGKTPDDGYYACSAYRNPKLCKFRQPAASWKGNEFKHEYLGREYPKLTRLNAAKGVSDPTSFLTALSQDDVHAQYFFDENALRFFSDQCQNLEISKVLCIGAPRVHFSLRKNSKVRSFLLDFDERFAAYLTPQEFCLYNMCNNHFFYKRQHFVQFLQCGTLDRLLIVTDPPFACRTELIAHMLRALTRLHNRINQLPHTPLAIFWVYPYYMEKYIQQEMQELKICDYKFNYTNHARYTNVSATSRQHGSPVRLFTNVPEELLWLRSAEGYNYCNKCKRYSAIENMHCPRCAKCPSKNGQTYIHCESCDLCVKPNYVHCFNCRRCAQHQGHQCVLYQSKQCCFICRERGHIETNCLIWLKRKGKCPLEKKQNRIIRCLLCGRLKHNELKCPQRHRYLKEIKFMDQVTFVSVKSLHPKKRVISGDW